MLTTIIISENSNVNQSYTMYLGDKKEGTVNFVLHDYGYRLKNVEFNYNISNNNIIFTYISKRNNFNEEINKCRDNREHIYNCRQEELQFLENKIATLKYELTNEFENNIVNNISLSENEYEIRKNLNQLYDMKKKQVDEINTLSKIPICFKYVETKTSMESKVKFNEWSKPICICMDEHNNNYDIIFNYTENIPNKDNRVKEITQKTEMNFIENYDDDDDDFDDLIM